MCVSVRVCVCVNVLRTYAPFMAVRLKIANLSVKGQNKAGPSTNNESVYALKCIQADCVPMGTKEH